MKQIPLTQGKVALIDDEDFEFLSSLKWYATKTDKHYYAYRGAHHRKDVMIMHRVIMNCPSGLVVDHIDGNTLNNQKINLRICSRSQNSMNKNVDIDSGSGFKGVSWSKGDGKWRARIRLNGKSIWLGNFCSADEAARAYDNAAKKLFGEFAKTNF
jgi:hypothetical protein